ncbi:hypothetical protein BGW36DRAFT_464533, partial [Talaromyces proteolyticus]
MTDTPLVVDVIGLETPAHHLNMCPQLAETEGDVMRDFDQNIIVPVELAFSGSSALSKPNPNAAPIHGAPKLWSRSLVGSSESGSSTKTVDYQMMMSHREPSLELPCMIGELKKPQVIKLSQWLFNPEYPADGKTTRLQQELRGYAYKYQCPQVFLFDTRTLVIVQFRASSVQDIREEDCPVDCCVIPWKRLEPDQCSIPYALYRLASWGYIRLSGTLECKYEAPGECSWARKSLSLDG